MGIIKTTIFTTLYEEREGVLRSSIEVDLFRLFHLLGYYSRVVAIEMIVTRFIRQYEGNCQIISLGGGYDTLFFRLYVWVLNI